METIAISTDTHFAHWMWRKTSPAVRDVMYAMGADPAGTVSRAYGVWNPVTGLNRRGRFIIDPDGVIQGVEVLAEPIGRNTDELIRQIQAMQAVRGNPGMAAPAGWKPGEELIETGKDQIGAY